MGVPSLSNSDLPGKKPLLLPTQTNSATTPLTSEGVPRAVVEVETSIGHSTGSVWTSNPSVRFQQKFPVQGKGVVFSDGLQIPAPHPNDPPTDIYQKLPVGQTLGWTER